MTEHERGIAAGAAWATGLIAGAQVSRDLQERRRGVRRTIRTIDACLRDPRCLHDEAAGQAGEPAPRPVKRPFYQGFRAGARQAVRQAIMMDPDLTDLEEAAYAPTLS